MIEIHWIYVLILFGVALIAGIVDAIAGGGGLITLPALLFAGLSPAQAIATNKIQALTSVSAAAHKYYCAGLVDFKRIKLKLIASTFGAAFGAYAIQMINAGALARIVPFILVAVSLFFAIPKNSRRTSTHQMLGEASFALFACVPIGFYDGFFGPGTGSLYAAAFVILLRRPLDRATAETKMLNTAGSVIAACMFLRGGTIIWPIAIAMALGAALGGRIGARLALHLGSPLIRWVLVFVSVAAALRLFSSF